MVEESIYYVSRVFEKVPFPATGTRDTQFDDCTFKNCDFTDTDFRGCDFSQCTFDGCNLSMVKFGHIGFDQVRFSHCKMVGADFSNTKDFLFSANFDNCILDYAAFMKKKNRKSRFENCSLKGTDFSESDLTSTKFHHCDLSGAVFMHTVLNEANFVTSYHFTIDPERNQLRKARFATEGLAGLLANYGIIVEES
ncbi:pentapeptide repeat-containing protein [Pedobacter sp. KR3-3]|uniref:Pentapeptide repeat-containing protein n=1 Tax=Pedobacter albus TaxID=3113905 RepID=A0ABU7I8W5_9SPHI|nr:pentapeptide repeat-containing protein [Pedobacter sp. KR3-3]MEE1945917.1 pentapeptide repeat-containing protein [Pedobacter sp. KR3-3]